MEQMSDLFVEHRYFKFQDETQFFILQQLNIEKSRFRKHSWLQLAYALSKSCIILLACQVFANVMAQYYFYLFL